MKDLGKFSLIMIAAMVLQVALGLGAIAGLVWVIVWMLRSLKVIT